ncbi:glycosyltransferase family 4 protein [Halapricum hydrolyticum]|uniref:Glycosyltransferase family 4 protein n=1 Tax=Halapricum hydrolyticum TaxID=2979991 RepID=A0AAE3LKJ8_9EURY|nr:glycosyltransferase family 4 protein [Halapricum hydrolyticum]MCU4719439.1 glycosyltransferase family 4 protein [Halapricum hydrolyticum]MCU4728448.1 glycosyltransferase family 4 protein [Halapricum hydrolyticum]
MGTPSVAAFTDTYLPTVNGVTYTVKSWREAWESRGHTMDLVYPKASEYDPGAGEYPVRSVRFPFYEGYRLGAPQVPDAVTDADIVHTHTPFGVGLSGLRLARSNDLPLVASYHTPTSEYAEYIAFNGTIERTVRRCARSYERWFFGHADLVIAPSDRTREHIRDEVGIDTDVAVVANGVDIDRFKPVDTDDFRERYDVGDGPIVGYTGRHGYEKCLSDVLAAIEGMDVTVLFAGDGPARDDLEARAERLDADVRFLGFLDREELPAFYSTLDVFAFPSPVETQGLVALEANACGTPVVGVGTGALSDTIVDGETGYRYPQGDIEAFRDLLERALRERDRLSQTCLDRREQLSVEHSVDRLEDLYASVLADSGPTPVT